MEVTIQGPAGRLEALFDPLEGAAAAAVVCHPHPLHGGTMHNTVVFRTARALRSAGVATLRFNFRGVGASEGTAGRRTSTPAQHDGAGGEEDAAAALDWLAERCPGAAPWAAGYSFGARTVAALALRDARIERLICVALPSTLLGDLALERVAAPGYLLFAGEDRFGTLATLRAARPELPPSLELDEIEGTDHFFRNRTPELEARVRAWAERALEPSR